jgi:hypothetical protein
MPKTVEYEYDIQQDFGYGWETVCCELTPEKAEEMKRCYQANQPEYPVRIKKTRVAQ